MIGLLVIETHPHPSAYPSHRKLTQDKEKLLKSMADRAAKTRDILLAMKQILMYAALFCSAAYTGQRSARNGKGK